MKLISTLFLTFAIMQLNAQTIQPEDATISYDGKSRPCLLIAVDPEAKTLKKAWKEYIKKNHDVKLKGIGFLSNKDLLSRKEVVIAAISPNAMDFYTEIIENETGSQMRVFASFGYDMYIDPATMPKEYEAMREIMTTFLNTYIPNYYQKIIDDTQKVVNDLSNDQKKLKKSISKDKKRVEKYNGKIEDLNKSLKDDSAELEEVETKLTNRESKLKGLKSKLNSVK